MSTAELTRASNTAATAEYELTELARSLSVLAETAEVHPEAVHKVSRGFLDLSMLARSCGKTRIAMTARALSTILNGLERAPENDAPFIMDNVVRFLDSIQASPDWRAAGARA